MNPKVSIIVPVYKAELYLSRCVDSILSQTFLDFELLLIDDGSPDNSGMICDNYKHKDSRIRVFHTSNNGVSNARNLGIEKSTGEYLLFIDSDDYVSEDYVESYFREQPVSRDTLIVQGCTVLKDETEILLYKLDNNLFIKSNFADMISEYELFKHGSPYGKLYHATILNENGIKFNTSLHNYEDLIFFLEYISCIRYIQFLPFVGYHYCMNTLGLHVKYYGYDNERLLLDMYLDKIKPLTKANSKAELYSLKLFMRQIMSLYIGNSKTRYHKMCMIRQSIKEYRYLLMLPPHYLSIFEKICFRFLKSESVYIVHFILVVYSLKKNLWML